MELKEKGLKAVWKGLFFEQICSRWPSIHHPKISFAFEYFYYLLFIYWINLGCLLLAICRLFQFPEYYWDQFGCLLSGAYVRN